MLAAVFWLELDDKALLDSYTVLQEGILCDVFSQKVVQQHGRARQVKGLRSPLCCRAVKMQMTGLTSCCLKEPLAHLYNSGDSHRGDFQTDLSQGAAQAAGQASLNGGQAAPPFVQHDDRDSLG